MADLAAEQSFRHVILYHAARYPAWQIADLYKLMHQGALGSEHAITDPGRARRWLEDELAHLAPVFTEPLIDPISAGAEIVRVHLRPFACLNLSSELLLDAFLKTAVNFQGSMGDLERGWLTAMQLCKENLLPFDPLELAAFLSSMRAQEFPAVHHSQEYEEAYHPAYRVVARVFLPAELRDR